MAATDLVAVGWVMPKVPFLDRFVRAHRAGFAAVEFMFPYAHPVHALRERLDDTGLHLALHNLPAGDWEAGERGIACHPDRVDEFRAGVGQAIAYATALGVPRLNCLVGRTPAGVPETVVRRTLVANLRFAAAELKSAGLTLLIEPINTFDIPGFWLNRTAQAIALMAEVDAPNLLLQDTRCSCTPAAVCHRPSPRAARRSAPPRAAWPSAPTSSSRWCRTRRTWRRCCSGRRASPPG